MNGNYFVGNTPAQTASDECLCYARPNNSIHLCDSKSVIIKPKPINTPPPHIVGSINLNSCLSVVLLNEPIRHYKFVFDVCTTERVYHLAADTEEERLEWVSTLRDLLFPSQAVSIIMICVY